MKLFKCYWAPTPKKWRKIGDTLLIVATFANTFEIVHDNHDVAITIMILGVAGKFLTNFFRKNAKPD